MDTDTFVSLATFISIVFAVLVVAFVRWNRN